MTMLVMQESEFQIVWAYPVEKKGSSEVWITGQLIEDLETIGLQGDRIVLKSDQEVAIVDLLQDVARQRQADYGTAVEQSKVGESDSNAHI